MGITSFSDNAFGIIKRYDNEFSYHWRHQS